jgi:hypothetical protein
MRMLDELVSDMAAAPDAKSPDIKSPDKRIWPADTFFGPRLPPFRDIEKIIPGADTHPPPPDAGAPQIEIQPADAIPGRAFPKDGAKASARQGTPFFVRLLRNAARLLIVAGLCGLAWAAGAYYSSGHSPFGFVKSSQAVVSPQRDDMADAMRQMAAEIRTLKADVDGRDIAPGAGQSQAIPAPAATPALTDLAGKVDKLDADFATRLSQVDERLAHIEQQIAAPHAALAARVASAHKRAKHLHDAFDPSRDPGAPGAPRPLGAF